MGINLPTIAGFFSTALFTLGALPMLSKAFRTRNLASYSLGNILMSNVGYIIYSIYVFHLPPEPIWFLHSYNLLTAGLMIEYREEEGNIGDIGEEMRQMAPEVKIALPMSHNILTRTEEYVK